MPFWGLFVQKKAKIQFQKMAANSQGQSRLRSNSQTKCSLPQAMSPPSFVRITEIDLGKSTKKWFLKFKMATISRNLEQLGWNFALSSGTTQDLCMQNIIGISVKLRALDPTQRFEHTFWILLLLRRRRLQTYQTHIGPKLHVRPNYYTFKKHSALADKVF